MTTSLLHPTAHQTPLHFTLSERALGALLGSAVADALGGDDEELGGDGAGLSEAELDAVVRASPQLSWCGCSRPTSLMR